MGTAVGAFRSTVGRRALVRALVFAASLALLAPGTVQQAGAEDVSGAGTANVLTCEAAGGEATVSSNQTANGNQTVSVECNGGYLDGWNCLHDSGLGTWNCSTEIIIVPDDGKAPTGGLGIDPTTNGGGTESLVVGADSDASRDAHANLVAPNDEQHQDHNTSKHSKGKHGKKGGKRHKR
jgi:hypothetical protein